MVSPAPGQSWPEVEVHLGGSEIWVLVLVALVVFGAGRLPQIMKGLGQGIKEFKVAVRDEDDHAAKPAAQADKDADNKVEAAAAAKDTLKSA
jgi:sec-independent protein translocase protein TatA